MNMANLVFEKSHEIIDEVPEVSVKQVLDNKENVLVIDVRTPEEWVSELGHIEGSVLKTLGEPFESHVNTLDPSLEVVIICRSGRRSAGATLFMREKGFSNVYNMTGGMIAWNEASQPIKIEI